MYYRVDLYQSSFRVFFTMHAQLASTLQAANEIIVGKDRQIRLAITCLLARGHLLIEDHPGVGKTTLAHLLAQLLGLPYLRIQFTTDLLPADILGTSIYDREQAQFSFHPGPIFTSILLADEINRASPKVQSALLEAMEEHQVTVDGETRKLPQPFFVIATQNPEDYIGTYPLPESQLDRFLMRITLGYPDAAAERLLLTGRNRQDLIQEQATTLDTGILTNLQQSVENIHTADALLDYIQALVQFSRDPINFRSGLSPRAALALLRSAQAWALLDGRDAVMPEDVQQVLPSVAGHRLRADLETQANTDLASLLLHSVPVP